MIHEKQLLAHLLLQFSDNTATQYYMKQYASQNKLAVIKVGGGVIKNELPQLCQSLLLLNRLGLKIVILHGAGPQIDKAIFSKGLSNDKKHGIRVTPKPLLTTVTKVVEATGQQLCRHLSQLDMHPAMAPLNLFECKYLDRQQYGEVGQVQHVSRGYVDDMLATNQIPVISCLGTLDNGQTVNINADVATRELVWSLKADKVIFVTATGGLLDKQQKIISAIHLNSQYESLKNKSWVHSGMRLKLQQIKQLLDPSPEHMSVSITSANHIAKELFTHGGAGTFISKGTRISYFDDIQAKHVKVLARLLESSFRKKLKPWAFKDLNSKTLLISECEEAAALVCCDKENIPYLDKFAVTPKAQGRGLGKALWIEIRKNYPKLYWRSRSENNINAWYYQQADMTLKGKQWTGFCYGIEAEKASHLLQKSFSYEDAWL